jgi:hypothetical protein
MYSKEASLNLCLDNRSLCCSWTYLRHGDLSYSWMCLHYRGRCCTWTCLRHTRGHRDLLCTWTCLDNRSCAAPGHVYITGSELHLDVSGQQEPLLLSGMSTLQGLSYTWTYLDYRSLCCSLTCLHYRGLSCTWTYLDYRSLCCPGLVYPTRTQASADL